MADREEGRPRRTGLHQTDATSIARKHTADPAPMRPTLGAVVRADRARQDLDVLRRQCDGIAGLLALALVEGEQIDERWALTIVKFLDTSQARLHAIADDLERAA